MKIGIIGAGPGGLAAGDLLAHYGYDVTIYEKESEVGGRNAKIQENGYTFDIGPTFFMMDFILKEIFEECGRDLDEYVDLVELDPYYQIVYSDGDKLKLGPDKEKNKESISNIEPDDRDGYESFMKDNKKKLDRTLPALQRGYYKYTDIISSEVLKMLPVLRPFTSLWDDLGKHFSDEKIKVGFTFQSKYLGMSPYNCPSMFSIIPYIEHTWDIYHAIGGLNQLAEGMTQLFREKGGEVRLDSEVEEIKIEDGEAQGIELSSGEEIELDQIIMNSDFAWSMKNLIPNEKRNKYSDEKIDNKKFSCSTFMLYLGLDKLYEDLEHHNVFITEDYERNFKEIEELKVVPEDPSFYVQNASITDPTLAPEGHSTLYVLVPVPNLKSDADWESKKEEYRNQIINKLEEKAELEDLEGHIEYEKILTPLDWKEEMNVGIGSTFNLSHNIRQMLVWRPRNKFEEFDNMWIVGGGTNPGSGLPTIYESGRIAAHEIKKRFGNEGV